MVKRLVSIGMFLLISLSSLDLMFRIQYLGFTEVRGAPDFIDDVCSAVSDFELEQPIVILDEDLQIWAGPVFAGCKVPVHVQDFTKTEQLFLALGSYERNGSDPVIIGGFSIANSTLVTMENRFVERSRGRVPQAISSSTSRLAISHLREVKTLEDLDLQLTTVIEFPKSYEMKSTSPLENLAILKQGWSMSEDWGTWADGPSATIQFALAESPNRDRMDPACVQLHGRSYLAADDSFVQVNYVQPNQDPIELPQQPNSQFVLDLISNPDSNGLHKIYLEFPSPVSPLEMGLSNDKRKLSIALESVKVLDFCES